MNQISVLYEADHSKGGEKAKENRANADIKGIAIVFSDWKMPLRPSEYGDDLSAAIAQYLIAANEVMKRVDHLLHLELMDQLPEIELAAL